MPSDQFAGSCVPLGAESSLPLIPQPTNSPNPPMPSLFDKRCVSAMGVVFVSGAAPMPSPGSAIATG